MAARRRSPVWRPDGEGIALVILDLVMPGLDGMAVLAKLRERERTMPVIVQTAHGGIDTVVGAMRAGAVDFVVKPVAAERLQVSIENALKLGALEGEIARMKRAPPARSPSATSSPRARRWSG